MPPPKGRKGYPTINGRTLRRCGLAGVLIALLFLAMLAGPRVQGRAELLLVDGGSILNENNSYVTKN